MNIRDRILFYLKPNIISGGYEIMKKPTQKMIHAYDKVWYDPSLPEKQYQIVREQLAAFRKTKKAQIPYSPLIDLLSKIPNNSGDVLEIGCSSGYYNEVLKIAGFKFKYQGSDYSENFINLAKKLYPKIKFKVSNAIDLDYKKNEFDITISAACLLHIANYAKAVDEAARVTKKYLILHRTPVFTIRPTTFFTKRGYGLEMMEVVINEAELIEILKKNGFALIGEVAFDKSSIASIPEPVFWKSYLAQKIK